MTKVMVFGTFDILHKGHLDFLRQAKRHGDYLVVVVARDRTVANLKGRHPLHGENERLLQIIKAGVADKAVLGNLHDKYAIIKRLKPNLICLGYDQKSFTEELKRELSKRNIKARVVRLKPYMQLKYKSSKIRAIKYPGK
jgi:FAD synthetase